MSLNILVYAGNRKKYFVLKMEANTALLSILIFDNKTFIAYYCVILHFTMQKMQVQQTILATLRSDLPTLSELVTSNQDKSRQALGKLICSKFKLLNTKGRPRISGCMKALYVLRRGRTCFASQASDGFLCSWSASTGGKRSSPG